MIIMVFFAIGRIIQYKVLGIYSSYDADIPDLIIRTCVDFSCVTAACFFLHERSRWPLGC